jgi:acyl-CoA reductase-like NAD-dependent aldehyde dehydrogenase
VESEVHRQPLGLVMVIAPGNYPLFLGAVQVLQALAAGNAVWIKPAPGAAKLMISFRDALVRAGFVADLIQVLPESVEATQAAIDTGVDKVVFTGSAETGRHILARLAPRLTPAIMELSGCDAVFLRVDADLDLAARAICFGLTLNRGATCIAPRRIFVPRQLLGNFTRALLKELKAADSIHLGTGAIKRWLPWVKEALADGAFIVAGKLHSDHVTAPLVLSGTASEMKLLRDDSFAPVACLVTVDSEEEALTANSQCPFALSASVFGKDASEARQFAERIRAGSVIVNDLIAPTADPRLPFGGTGQSGFGVTRGAEGLLEMTSPKVVITNRSRMRMHYQPFREADTPLFQSLLRLSHSPSLIQKLRALFQTISIVRQQNRKKKQRSS